MATDAGEPEVFAVFVVELLRPNLLRISVSSSDPDATIQHHLTATVSPLARLFTQLLKDRGLLHPHEADS